MLTARTAVQSQAPAESATPRRDRTGEAAPLVAADHAYADVSVHAPALRSEVRLARDSGEARVGHATFDGATIVAAKGNYRAVCDAFTSSSAPTPNGRFCVRRQGEAQHLGGWRGALAWGLSAFYDRYGEGPVRKDTSRWFLIEPQFTTSRSRMQIHYGIASEGCVTVTDSDCFHRLETILEQPGTDSGWGYDGYPPGNDADVSKDQQSVDCVAWLDVTDSTTSTPTSESAEPPPVRIAAHEEMPLYRTLRPGYSGPDVKTLQQRLSDESFALLGPPVTGVYGPETTASVIAFQLANGLHVDGIAGPETIARLRLLERQR
jgi:hypothetical protein